MTRLIKTCAGNGVAQQRARTTSTQRRPTCQLLGSVCRECVIYVITSIDNLMFGTAHIPGAFGAVECHTET